MDKYIYEVVETEQQEYQEAKPGRNILFDFEDGDIYYFSSSINVVRFIYNIQKYNGRIRTHETNPAYEFCLLMVKNVRPNNFFAGWRNMNVSIGSHCRGITTQKRIRNFHLLLCFQTQYTKQDITTF